MKHIFKALIRPLLILVKNRLVIISLSVFLILTTAIFTFWSVSTPLKKLRNFNAEFGAKQANKPCSDHPSLHETIKEITYLEAYTLMAKGDSIGLIVNLNDSTASLVLKGVIIHSAKIRSISTDGFFNALDICAYRNLFSSPLQITNQQASIEKEPIVIKKAPKSEAEASDKPYFPDTLKNKRVTDIDLSLNAGFKIFIHDGSDGCIKAKKNISTPGEIWRNMKRFIVFKKPEYQPAIHICIEKNDAISIYRALPQKAVMIVRI